jgi:hypothetical protein
MEKNMKEQTEASRASKEQIKYANLLFLGCWGGLALMVFTYLIYILGIFPPHVPMDKVIVLWTKSVGTYLSEGDVHQGWAWATMLNKGDFLNFLGIALLAGMTIICYIPLIPTFFKKKDYAYAMMAIGEILVLALAASGIFGAGGH